MRIAIFHELPNGGAKRAVYQFAKQLKIRHNVDLYYIDEREDPSITRIFSTVFYYKFLPKSWKGGNWKIRLYKDTVELEKLKILHKRIAKEIDREKYDILFVHGSKFTEAPFVLRFANTKTYFYCHNPHYRIVYESNLHNKKSQDRIRSFYEWVIKLHRKNIDRKNFLSADKIIANSIYTKNKIKKTYRVSSVVKYLGVDTEFFHTSISEKTIDILFVGSYEPVDDYSLLLAATQKLTKKPVVRAVLMEKEWLTAAQMHELYKKTKVVVCLGRNEPFGMVVLEAMSSGVPVIAVDEAGYKETVRHMQTGVLIKRDPQELTDALSLLLEDKALRGKMGKKAREDMVRNWSWTKRVGEIQRFFENEKKEK